MVRHIICTSAAVLSLASFANAQQTNPITLTITPKTFFSGEYNNYPDWGPQIDCPTYHSSAAIKDQWVQNHVCGGTSNQNPIWEQIGPSNGGNNCGYARYSVACVKIQ